MLVGQVLSFYSVSFVDCMGRGNNDMKDAFVIDPLIGKKQQLQLATQLCRMVLKVNNVIVSGSGDEEF